jgi:hypothetical protein
MKKIIGLFIVGFALLAMVFIEFQDTFAFAWLCSAFRVKVSVNEYASGGAYTIYEISYSWTYGLSYNMLHEASNYQLINKPPRMDRVWFYKFDKAVAEAKKFNVGYLKIYQAEQDTLLKVMIDEWIAHEIAIPREIVLQTGCL